MLGMAIGSFLLLLAVAYMVARPLFAPEANVEEAEDSKLLAEKERQLAEIRELDMDFATGKLTEDDYHKLRARSLADAAATMQALDEAEAEGSVDTAADKRPEHAIPASNGHAALEHAPLEDAPEGVTDEEDELERAIAARKRSIEEKVR